MRTIIFIFALLLMGLLLLSGFRSLAFQPFSIPAASMSPNLIPGDNVLASKFAYGYSRYSFPFGLDIRGRIWGGEPKRGDLVIFRLPRNNATDYVKRVVGLPGDRIQMIRGVLQINGQPVRLRRIEDLPAPHRHAMRAATVKPRSHAMLKRSQMAASTKSSIAAAVPRATTRPFSKCRPGIIS